MSCGIIKGECEDRPRQLVEIFYDSVTMTAFGPIMDEGNAEAFADWLRDDPRTYDANQLEKLYDKYQRGHISEDTPF